MVSLIDEAVYELEEMLWDKFGISVSYESLSPSILTSFYVKGVEVKDRENNSILYIDIIKADYNLFKLLKKDFKNIIQGVVIDGVNLNINDLITVLPNFLPETQGPSKITFSEILDFIPHNLKLKNLNFVYNHEQANINYNVKSISVAGKSNNTALEVNIDSFLDAYVSSLDTNVKCKLGIFGAVTEDFNNSQLNLTVKNFSAGDIKMKKLKFHASYIDNIVDVHTIQVTEPVSIGVFLDTVTQDFSIGLNTDNLRLGNITAPFVQNDIIEKLKDARITTGTRLTSNINSKKIKLFSDTNVQIPDAFIPGGMDCSFVVEGNDRSLSIENLRLKNKTVLASADLAVDFNGFHVSGLIDIPYFVMPNGNIVSTEIYLDPMDTGFSGFCPQVYIGSKAFTAVNFAVLPQKDSIDFSFEMSDYSHTEESVPGLIKLDGSYLIDSKYLQSNISLNTIYLDSLARTAGECLPGEYAGKIKAFEEKLSPYVFSGDIYCSTDFNSLSYNVPYILLANVQDENQVVMVSLNGNEQSVQLNQLALILGGFGIQLSGSVDKSPDSPDLFFDLDVNSSAIPYHVTGTLMPQVCNIMGDYGTNIEVRFNDNMDIEGFVEMNNLPILIKDKSIVVSTHSDIKYNKEDGPTIKIDRFETELITPNLPVNPRVSFSGNATKYGIQLDNFAYTDYYSALQGQSDIMIDFSDGILSSASVNLNLQNPLSTESVYINGNVSNPDNLEFSKDNLINNFYIDLQTQVNNLCLDRFGSGKNEKNRATGFLYASGTVAHPYINLGIEDFSMYSGSSLITASGNALVEDRDVSLVDINLSYGNFQFNSLEAQASLDDFSMNATCDFRMNSSDKYMSSPVKITMGDAHIPEGSFLPDSFGASLIVKNLEGTILKKAFPVEVYLDYNKEGTSFISSDNIGIEGFLSSDGILEVNIDNGSFLKAKVDGFIAPKIANIQLYDLDFDMSCINDYLSLEKIFNFDKGHLTGEAVVTGSFSAPDINGNMELSDLVYDLPFITPAKLTSSKAYLNIVNNVINVPPFLMTAKKGRSLETQCDIYLDNWSLDYVDGKVKTPKNNMFPAHILMKMMKIEGDVAVDGTIFYQDSVLDIKGDVFGENMEVTSGLESITNMMKDNKEKEENSDKKKKGGLKYKLDLDTVLGTHTSVAFSPILRCIMVPGTKFNFYLDQTVDEFGIDGELKLRSGDIAYINRNFYIKSGALKFNTDDFGNPIITLRAETRERDDRGQPVKIILDVENQPLLSFKPHFRSEPARSESEIRRILGQIAVGDSENAADFIFAAGDYALQSTVVRKVENKLRDLLNFDIFSVRTNVLQNTLNMGFSGSFSKENFSIGNFLDNSTVYIGKYLSSSLYLDAMLHVSFERNNFTDMSSAGSIVFQPELGLELESPFANIRLNLAPDINALIKNNQFVPSPSVTLSWGFSF